MIISFDIILALKVMLGLGMLQAIFFILVHFKRLSAQDMIVAFALFSSSLFIYVLHVYAVYPSLSGAILSLKKKALN